MPTRRDVLATAATLTAASALSPRLFAAARPAKKKLGVALVGLGRLSTNQLAPALQTTEHAELTAVVSGTPSKREEWSKKYDLAPEHLYSYETFDRIADDDAVDVIYVVLPNGMHKEYTVRAAEAGKHVFCEKPMAVSADECRTMIAACERAGVRLGVAYRCQFEPHHLRAIEAVSNNELGTLRGVGAGFGFRIPDFPEDDPKHWRLEQELGGGGPLMDVGIYALQFCRYITGREPRAVTARTVTTNPEKFDEVEETLFWTMNFPADGDRPEVLANCGTTYNFGGIKHGEAFCDEGSVLLDPAYGYSGIEGFVKGEPMGIDNIDQFAKEIDAFALAVKNDEPFRCPGEEGLRDLLAIEAIYEAAESGKRVEVAEV